MSNLHELDTDQTFGWDDALFSYHAAGWIEVPNLFVEGKLTIETGQRVAINGNYDLPSTISADNSNVQLMWMGDPTFSTRPHTAFLHAGDDTRPAFTRMYSDGTCDAPVASIGKQHKMQWWVWCGNGDPSHINDWRCFSEWGMGQYSDVPLTIEDVVGIHSCGVKDGTAATVTEDKFIGFNVIGNQGWDLTPTMKLHFFNDNGTVDSYPTTEWTIGLDYERGYFRVTNGLFEIGTEQRSQSYSNTRPGLRFNGFMRSSSAPTSTEFPDGTSGIHKNTVSGDVNFVYNDGGSIVALELT